MRCDRAAMCFLLSLFLSSAVLVHGQLGNNPVVNTEFGPVQGHTLSVFDGVSTGDVHSFLGVPFGASTAGANRFLSPVPPDPWVDVFQADQPATNCPQAGLFDIGVGEDCLQLNIAVPADAGAELLPVMVWIYGGGYQAGGIDLYPGHFMARHGVIVVTVNYRLDNIGFAFTGDAAAPGNAGLMDQLLGLQFVKNNIANFGGDPNRVTLFGESAGAASTALHVISPLSGGAGMFQQAITHSGTEANVWSTNPPESNPLNYTLQLAESLNCLSGDNFAMMDCLRQLPWEDITDANIRCSPGWLCLGMAPVVDGAGGFLPQKVKDLRDGGNIMTGPIITGINRDDGSLFTSLLMPSSLLSGFTREEFEDYLYNRILGIFDERMDDQTKQDMFEAANYEYSPWPYVDDEYANRDAMNELITDASFGVAWDYLGKDQSQYSSTYMYLFDYRSINTLIPEWMGVPHAAEIPYTWGYALMQDNPALLPETSVPVDDSFTQTDKDYTYFWQTLLSNFAKFGNPSPSPVPLPDGQGSIQWTDFTFENMDVFYMSNTTVEVTEQWRQKEYAFWTQYGPYLWTGVPGAPGSGRTSESEGSAKTSSLMQRVQNAMKLNLKS